jgi:hypothetical protein
MTVFVSLVGARAPPVFVIVPVVVTIEVAFARLNHATGHQKHQPQQHEAGLNERSESGHLIPLRTDVYGQVNALQRQRSVRVLHQSL